MRQRRSASRRGNSIMEFGLCLLVLAPALLGMFTVGMNLTRNLQAMQLARDAGHMYVRNVDFSEAKNQRLLARLGRELKMVQDGTPDTPDANGRAVVILTKFHVPTMAECLAAGLDAGDCVNVGVPVISQRLWIGNKSLFASPFGTPAPGKLRAKGAVDNSDVLQDTALRATQPEMLPIIPLGQDAYLAEVYAASPDFDMASVMSGTGVYARAIY